MLIRLTRKLADCLDGIDVSGRHVGDVFDLPTPEAKLLIAERWAERWVERHSSLDPRDEALTVPVGAVPAQAIADAHSSSAAVIDRIREVRRRLERQQSATLWRRRAEDRVREQLRDERSRVARAHE
jgi:hypothetical protein